MEYIFYAYITFLDYYLKEDVFISPPPQKIKVLSTQSVSEKKQQFYTLVLPPLRDVYTKLQKQYLEIQKNIDNPAYKEKITKLKKIYKVTTDEALLMALKPHPISIALAQAAMESAWGTSRFFHKANNIFGMWSVNKNEKRIPANEQRKGKYTIWLKKFDSLEDSIRAYYITLSRAKAYKKFRKLNYETDDVYIIITGLTSYSERGEKYVKELGNMIRYNHFTQYDK